VRNPRIDRHFLKLIWPLIVEQLLAVAMGACDNLMVSPLGEYTTAGVNIVDNINQLLVVGFAALCTGGAVVVSQYIGRQALEHARASAKQLIYAVTLLSLGIMAVAIPLRRPIIHLFYGSIEPDVMAASLTYFLFTACSYPALALYNANAALLRATKDMRTPMRIALMVNIMNVGGNYLFIFVLKIGVMGAALSTLICRVAAAAVTTAILHRSSGAVSLAGLFRVRFLGFMVKDILGVGIPSFFENSMFWIGKLLTQRIFPLFGTGAIAANAITGMINSLAHMTGGAYGMALQAEVGQLIGAGNYPAAKKKTGKIMIRAYRTMFIVAGLIAAFARPLVGLSSLTPASQAIAVQILQIHMIFMATGWPMSFTLPNALRAAGDGKFVMAASALSMWFVRVGCSYLFALGLGLGPLGVWMAMGCDFLSRGAVYLLRWRGGRWQAKRVIKEKSSGEKSPGDELLV
jgi:putative MATE family efflux protein